MNANDFKIAKERILRGESAKLVVSAQNFEAAEQIFSRLPPTLRARLTLIKGEV